MNKFLTINEREINNDMVIISIDKHRKLCKKRIIELLNDNKKFEKKIKDYFLNDKNNLNILIDKIINEDTKDPVMVIFDLYYN